MKKKVIDYKKLGQKGGLATASKYGPDYMRILAKKSWKSRRNKKS